MTNGVTYSSLLEVAGVLEDLSRERVAIHADLGEIEDAHVFESRILRVDPDLSHFIVAYVEDDSINSLLYKQSAIKFNANSQGDRISFFTHSPLDAFFDGKPAVYFPLPPSVLRYHRNHERIDVPAEAGLKCIVIDGKENPLEMKVVDISEGGIGCLIHTETEPFVHGAVLKHCKIVEQGGRQLRVVLNVQYSMPAMLPNGSYVQRAGMRFMEPPDDIRRLVKLFSRRKTAS